MISHRTAAAPAAMFLALSLAIALPGRAEEGTTKQSAASRAAAKARDYARQEKEGPADMATAVGTRGAKEGDKAPSPDMQAVDKAATETADGWKKLDKVLDRF